MPDICCGPQRSRQAVTEAWGGERMIYGGGFSAAAMPQSYRRHREEIGEYLAHLSETERRMIFSGTANRLFGFNHTA